MSEMETIVDGIEGHVFAGAIVPLDIEDGALVALLIEAQGPNGFWYLATPYSKRPDLDEAACEAAALAGRLMRLGVRVFCPVSHSHPIAVESRIDPRDGPFWLEADRPFMEAACGLLVADLPGWMDSHGIAAEFKQFSEAGKPAWLLTGVGADDCPCSSGILVKMPDGTRTRMRINVEDHECAECGGTMYRGEVFTVEAGGAKICFECRPFAVAGLPVAGER